MDAPRFESAAMSSPLLTGAIIIQPVFNKRIVTTDDIVSFKYATFNVPCEYNAGMLHITFAKMSGDLFEG